MKKRMWPVIGLSLVVALALGGCAAKKEPVSSEKPAASVDGLSGSLAISGSDTMVNLAQAWAEAFQKENGGVVVSVQGGGSGVGIAALINKTVDFANASRDLKPEEIEQANAAGVAPVATIMARDGIAVVVNPANGVSALTIDQIGRIYRGEIENWKQVGGADKPIVLLSRDTASGTYEYFKEAVVGKDKEYAKAARLLPSTQAIVDEVAGNEGAIGYVGVGYMSDKLKVIQVAGVAASVATVLDGTYPISRPLYMISDGALADLKKAYVEWILSPAGQKVVEEQGFVPVE
ncbi:MAG: PstS family phosphate ABC transporter substrate-binding protein [Coriobacteriia bacterium]